MTDRWSVYHGDCREMLRGLAEASVDAVVCDPPYELGFMGKAWDASGIAYDVTVWRECWRVLKPGGHLIAFGGSRTYHRLACAVEDAGFQIRDQVLWLYGSGFPKSLDVSKAIDKRGGAVAGFECFRDAVKAAMKANGISRGMLQGALGNFMLSHYLSAGSQPAVPTWRDYQVIRDTVRLGNEYDEMFRPEAERKIVAQQRGTFLAVAPGQENNRSNTTLNVTAPATDAARQWAGWGTALKPAHEPAVLARKPLVGTVAENVLAYGTGGINVDGCRIDGVKGSPASPRMRASGGDAGGVYGRYEPPPINTKGWDVNAGRWPANLIHDGSEAAVGIFPGEEDNSAARFFYCAKASRADREFGLSDDTPEVSAEDRVGREAGSAGMDNPRAGAGRTSAGRNHHPTVKPIALMRHLVRLVTPPGGLVADPFVGSGSTGVAAMLEGVRFVGAEMQADYHAMASARIAGAARVADETARQGAIESQPGLFDERL